MRGNDFYDNDAYVVHTQVLRVVNHPFNPTSDLREVWEPIFKDPKCFSNVRALYLGYDPRHRKGPSFPFVKSMGPICFNLRNARLESSALCGGRQALAWLLFGGHRYNSAFFGTGRDHVVRFQDSYQPQLYKEDDHNWERVFGYNARLNDQRMNYLHFELYEPLKLRVSREVNRTVEGKVFLHVYPCGYLVLHVAVSLRWDAPQTLDEIYQAIKETRPWGRQGTWEWHTKRDAGSLNDIVSRLKENIRESFLKSSNSVMPHGEWRSTIRVRTLASGEQLASDLLGAKDHIGIFERKVSGDLLVVTRQGVVTAVRKYDPHYPPNRKLILRRFWRLMHLHEFIILKEQIYRDYIDYLGTELLTLKQHRLNTVAKVLSKEEWLKVSFYDSKASWFLWGLDRFIKVAWPYERWLYSVLCGGSQLDKHRSKLKAVVAEWEDEVSKWERPLITLWKKLVAPIRSLLGG